MKICISNGRTRIKYMHIREDRNMFVTKYLPFLRKSILMKLKALSIEYAIHQGIIA